MSESKGQQLSLAAKLAKIGNEIGAVQKGARNTQQGYAYIEYSEVAKRIRSLFDKYSIAFTPEVESYEVTEVKNSKGNLGYHYVLRMKFTIINGENPDESLERHWLGESMDYGDKGINKAETSAVKYFLMRIFNVSEKGEVEADKETPTAIANNYQPNVNQTNRYNSAGAVVPASEKQVNFLAKLLKDLGRTEQEIDDAKKQARAESSKTVSTWIKSYQKKVKEQNVDVIPTEEEVNEFAQS